jgi:threonine dehydratase
MRAASALGLTAMVFVPENAARIKREKIAALGATLVVSGADYDEAERMARARATQEHLPFVSPFDDPDVIAGNGGSLARELLVQRPSLRRVIVPVGGGGLVSGLLEGLAGTGVEVLGVESAGACAMARSLAAGAAILEDHGETLCTGLDGGISDRTYAIATAHRLRVEVVAEDEILPAIAFAYRTLGQAIEPASATVIAAARRGQVPVDGETVLVITGGNIDPPLLDRALAS